MNCTSLAVRGEQSLLQVAAWELRLPPIKNLSTLSLECYIPEQVTLLRRILLDNRSTLQSFSIDVQVHENGKLTHPISLASTYNLHAVGPQHNWENLQLSDCEQLQVLSLAISLDTSMDIPNYEIDGFYGERNRALISFLAQLPLFITKLYLSLSLLTMARTDPYRDLRTVNWNVVGHCLSHNDHLQSVSIRLGSSYPDEFTPPLWTDNMLSLVLRHFTSFPRVSGMSICYTSTRLSSITFPS